MFIIYQGLYESFITTPETEQDFLKEYSDRNFDEDFDRTIVPDDVYAIKIRSETRIMGW